MASVSGSEVSSDGPVLNLINKKLRSLKKKYNRILQMEESQTLGKPLNKEQEGVLKSKPVVAALIDEYEKLRIPLASAVQEELSRLSPPPPSKEEEDDEKEKQSGSGSDSDLGDLLGLLYFGCLFDVKPQSEYTNTMLTRTLERECCLTYDYVTDEATDLLGERDLDLISTLGGLLTSRPVYAGVSHKKALEECIQHAKRWLHKSEELVPLGSHPGLNVTYAGLREKLNKIMALDYFTTTPEMKAPVDVAAAMGKYNNAQIQIAEGGLVQTQDGHQIDGALAQYQQKDDQGEIQAEVGIDQSSPLDENPKDEPSTQIPAESNITDQQDKERIEAESEHNEDHPRDSEHKGQHQYNSRRPYQNQRGGRGGGRRGFSNGRGGRGARGGGDSRGYQNGRSQQYYDSGYYPRNYYNSRGRGGGKSGGPAAYSNNNHGPAAAAAHGGHVAVGVNP